jgi:hypothetical protein
MDPIPLPTTIDSILDSISSTSLSITNFIRSVRSARTDLAAVTRELSDLRLVLELLRDEHDVPFPMQARSRAVLECCGATLRRINALLVDPSKWESGRGRWAVKEKSETAPFWIGLQTYREALGLVLEVANL